MGAWFVSACICRIILVPSRLTAILAQHRANIVETSYNRAYYGVNVGETAIDITMETRGPEHITELLSALNAGGYTHERVL